jgi:hypothetical protein
MNKRIKEVLNGIGMLLAGVAMMMVGVAFIFLVHGIFTHHF